MTSLFEMMKLSQRAKSSRRVARRFCGERRLLARLREKISSDGGEFPDVGDTFTRSDLP